MRDDQPLSDDRENTERPKAVKGRRSRRSAKAAPNDHPNAAQADSPAALAALSHPADVEEAGLSDEEIAMYRRRVAEGLYNSREVADEVARRMMRRGDI
jgi:hypothetical protein